MAPRTEDFGGELVSETETYLDRIEDCVALLPQLLDEYAAGDSYEATVERIQDLESECDRLNRRICGHITSSGPGEIGLLHAQVHLNAPSIVGLYQSLDDVANITERIAEELLATAPSPGGDWFERLASMAECATAAAESLSRAVAGFARALCAPSEPESITDEVTAIRDAESRCDGLRNEALRSIFGDETAEQPLLCRAFVLQFDRLVDVMEDVTDRMIIVTNDIPEITAEPTENHTPST